MNIRSKTVVLVLLGLLLGAIGCNKDSATGNDNAAIVGVWRFDSSHLVSRAGGVVNYDTVFHYAASASLSLFPSGSYTSYMTRSYSGAFTYRKPLLVMVDNNGFGTDSFRVLTLTDHVLTYQLADSLNSGGAASSQHTYFLSK